MLRFFMLLLVISLLATGGAYYWKAAYPQGPVVVVNGDAKSVTGSQDEAPDPSTGGATRSLGDRSVKIKLPSDMQNLAAVVGLVSSLLSGLGAMISAYFSWAHYRTIRMSVRGED